MDKSKEELLQEAIDDLFEGFTPVQYGHLLEELSSKIEMKENDEKGIMINELAVFLLRMQAYINK